MGHYASEMGYDREEVTQNTAEKIAEQYAALTLKDTKTTHVFDLKPGTHTIDLQNTKDLVIIRRDPSAPRKKFPTRIMDVLERAGGVDRDPKIYRVSFSHYTKMRVPSMDNLITSGPYTTYTAPYNRLLKIGDACDAECLEPDTFVRLLNEGPNVELQDVTKL